jgi:hypothetical protein
MKTKILLIVVCLSGFLFSACGPTVQITPIPNTSEPVVPTQPLPTHTPLPSPTTVADYEGTIGGASVNIRSGPGTNFNVVTSFTQSTMLKIIGRNDDCSWLVILIPDGGTGWIRSDLIQYSFSCDLLEFQIIPPTPTAKPYVQPTSAGCDGETVDIAIVNDTGGAVSMTLWGPCSYTFFVGSGSSSITILPGNYSYSAYGCGGATLSGSKDLGSGDEWTWYCQ